MDYTSLEDAYGSPFGQRVPVTHARKDAEKVPPPEKRATEAMQKTKSLIDELRESGSLPLDTRPETESFRVQHKVREAFSTSQAANVHETTTETDKLSRILRLIEQNRTGYERPSTQDMLLYIFTGIVFMFTFDTFVALGKTMGRK
jgi:hypothetical protein